MSIRLTPEGQKFWVELTPPQAEAWRSETPLTPTELTQALSSRGCNSADITNALQAAGPEWAARRDAAGVEWDWVLDSDGALRLSRAVCVAAGIAAATTVAILLAELVRWRAVPGVADLLYLGVPILVAGFLWGIAILLGRQKRERSSSQSWWYRAGKSDSRILFFEGLQRPLANALSVVAVFCVVIAMTGYPDVSPGAGRQRFCTGFLGAFFVVQFGIAAAELRRRRCWAGVDLRSPQT